MLRVLLFLSLFLNLCAREPLQAVSENDPSSLVEGVSMITGDLYTYDEDYVVQGAEPIHMTRSYFSRMGGFQNFNQFLAQFICDANMLIINEPNGTALFYFADAQNHIFPVIGEQFYGKEKKHRKALKYNALSQDDKGVANTKEGEISARSNLKNQYIVFNPKENEKGKSFTLYAADGTIRKYTHYTHQEKVKGPYGDQYIAYYYKLTSETLPNGHMIHYGWDDQNRMHRIYTTNASQTKTFASIEIPVQEGKEFPAQVVLRGSDQRSVTYNRRLTANKQMSVLCELISPDLPDQQYEWDMLTAWVGKEVQLPFLSSYSLPKSRTLKIEYYEDTERRVKTLKAPVGNHGELMATHTFSYDVPNKNSSVIDALGNRTHYYWNGDYRLTRVDRYAGQTLHSSDLFQWEGNLLKSKSFLDENGCARNTRTYEYDRWGNVRANTLSGNLTGSGHWEHHIKRSAYSEDGKNQLLWEEGSNELAITYTYWCNTHLPHVKTIYEGGKAQIVHTYTYDEDCNLAQETIEDGVLKRMKRITPYVEGYIGLPRIIEELCGDDVLLSKMVVSYGPGATVIQKDIYDSHNQLRYSLKMGYDSKGRLISETNALGQEAITKYDDTGNKAYTKDFSGRLETFYTYDFSNRLIQKEEKGVDGVHRIYKYGYNAKHHLVSETDPFGNETIYVPNAFGHTKEIRRPSIENETGERMVPVMYQTFDSAGNILSKTDAEGNVTVTAYTAYNQPFEITHPDGSKEHFRYYLDGNLKTHTDAVGVETSYTYDYLNRVKTKTVGGATEQFEYQGLVLIKKINAEGCATVYEYDRAGRKTSESFGGETTYFHYDEFNRVHKTVKGALVTRLQYDLLGRVIEEVHASDAGEILKQVGYEYDAAGNRKAVIRNISGKPSREQFAYDSVGRMIRREDALGFIETWGYDSKVHRTCHTDALGLETIQTYHPLSGLVSMEKRKNGKPLFSEKKITDCNGKLILQINAIYAPDGSQREVSTRWECDCRGRIKTLTEAAGFVEAKVTRYSYTRRNELETITKPSGISLTYRYNDLGYLESLSSSDGSVHHRMEYNLLGHLTALDGRSRTTDAFGRILTENFLQGISIENTYDNQGRRNTCKVPKADCLIAYDYDPLYLRAVTRKKLDETVLYAHSYSKYDLAGNVLEEHRIDGRDTVFTIDLLNRKTAISAFYHGQFVDKFDPVGNVLRERTCGFGYIDYTYDDLYQLTSEKGAFDHTYAYDSQNNRLRKDETSYSFNALNQIPAQFEYDANGNPAQYDNMKFTYDALDRLIRIESADFVQIFCYDALHRCLSKTTIEGQETKTQFFLYDGQNEIGSFDEEGRTIDLRILGNTPHAEIGATVAIELNGRPCAPIHDLYGNIAVVKLLDGFLSAYNYTAFGEEQLVGETISPWRFSSKRTDSRTKLVYFGRRFYMPAFGRWLTPDPAGFTDGMNLYAYVHNNPLTHWDEYGLLDMPSLQDSIYEFHKWSTPPIKPPPFHFGSGWNSQNTPIFYVNGINNTPRDAFIGTFALAKAFGYQANVRSIYSETRGLWQDLKSVNEARNNPNYTSDAVSRLRREIQWCATCLDIMNDPRKIFIVCFSRGSPETYHATKDLPQHQKDRLIITACGPIMTLPSDLGFSVTNLISEGDWCSLYFHPGLKKGSPSNTMMSLLQDLEMGWQSLCLPSRPKGNSQHGRNFSNVRLLPQRDGFSGFNRDHFFGSQTYQSAIKKFSVLQYDTYGVAR